MIIYSMRCVSYSGPLLAGKTIPPLGPLLAAKTGPGGMKCVH